MRQIFIIKKENKHAFNYYHLFTKDKKTTNKIYDLFYSDNVEFFQDKKLDYLFRLNYAMDEELDTSKILDLIQREKKHSKNIILKYLDKEYLDRLYNKRDSIIEEANNNIDQFNKIIQKLNIERLVENGTIDIFDINVEDDEEDDDDLYEEKRTPVISNYVYDNLPDILKNMINFIGNDDRKKDIFLMGILPTISLLFNNFNINLLRDDMSEETIKLNMYSFIVSSASSGKGVLKYLNDALFRYKQEIESYNNRKLLEMDSYNKRMMSINKKEKIVDFEKQEYNPFVPIIPANISNAALKSTLLNNNGLGLIIEQEADNLIKNNKSEWGGISEDLRSAFHNETISDLRLGRGITNIENPFISLIISGTLDQLKKFFYTNNSLENGLFSRFLFYYNSDEDINYNFIKEVKLYKKVENYENPIRLSSHELYRLHDYYRRLNKVDVEISQDQILKLNVFIREMHRSKMSLQDNNFKSVFNRSVLSIFKIATILTILRRQIKKSDVFDMDIDAGFYDDIILLNDIDIDISCSIYETIISHISWIYNGANETSKSIKEEMRIKVSDPKESVSYLDKVDKIFKRQDLSKVLINNNIIDNDSQVRNIIKKLISIKYIKKLKRRGHYEKI